MFALLRSLLAGAARFALGAFDYGWYWGCRFAGGMRDALRTPEPGPSEVGQLIEVLKENGLGGARQAVAEAVAAAPSPKRAPTVDAAAKREGQLAALRFTTAAMHGGSVPTLDGVPDDIARRLRKLSTRTEFAPIHKALVAALGYECRQGWWCGPGRDRSLDDDVVERRTVKLAH